MSRPQKGRKARKVWHRGSAQRSFRQITESWPQIEAPHDGAPSPRRQNGTNGARKNVDKSP